jgi:glutathione S-transferase
MRKEARTSPENSCDRAEIRGAQWLVRFAFALTYISRMSTIKLYWCPKTRAVRALWLLEEAGVPYERVYINIRDEKAKTDPAFRAASPMGKVPAIEDGPVRLNDSGAICAYIADQYPQAGLAPRIGDPQRGAYLQWLMFNNADLEPAMVERFQNLPPNPSTYGWGSFDLVLQQLRQGVAKGPYILGERFSAADIMLASGANYMFLFGTLKPENEPEIHAYTQRCLTRPAAQRAYAAEAEG